MDHKAVVKLCKELGCCDACCLRYIGVKSPSAYEKPSEHILKYLPSKPAETEVTDPMKPACEDVLKVEASDVTSRNGASDNACTIPSSLKPKLDEEDVLISEETTNKRPPEAGTMEPPAKRVRSDVCASCLGILQTDSWEQAGGMVAEVFEKKKYSAASYAVALSAPVVTLYRERVLAAKLVTALSAYDKNVLTPLKESWKWSFGAWLSKRTAMTLDSGKYAPLLVTVNFEYQDDLQELEVLKTLSPDHFASRAQQRRRFTLEFTRRSVSDALDAASVSALAAMQLCAAALVSCVSVVACHEPVYLAGRYIKLSRWLPQTPWLVRGRRVLASSVQDVIFTPIARAYDMSVCECESRVKLVSAGREDVDVRCLGTGRPFAVEISDPRRSLSAAELAAVCDEISAGGQVRVHALVHVTKEDLVRLKQGEETKSKTYEALVVKLKPDNDQPPYSWSPAAVLPRELAALCSLAPRTVQQRTPLRVLHRRPLLTRTRTVSELTATAVPNHPSLLRIRLKTDAGTYVKEFIHGECGRTAPSLATALAENMLSHSDHRGLDVGDSADNGLDAGDSANSEQDAEDSANNALEAGDSANSGQNAGDSANDGLDHKGALDMVRFDILALDVAGVHLDWPIVR